MSPTGIAVLAEPCAICNERHKPPMVPSLTGEALNLLRAQAACPMVCSGFSPTTIGQLLRALDREVAARVELAAALADKVAEATRSRDLYHDEHDWATALHDERDALKHRVAKLVAALGQCGCVGGGACPAPDGDRGKWCARCLALYGGEDRDVHRLLAVYQER